MELISYALDFLSFIMQNSNNVTKIKQIILFGSAARNDAKKDSDIDLFIDVISDEDTIQDEINRIQDKFYKSIKYKNYWKHLGIKNEFSPIAGQIDKWPLKDSMLGNSLVLYGAYSPKIEKGLNKTLIYWDNIKNNSKRVMLNKKLFGFRHYKHQYKGLLEVYGAKKLGANVILINTQDLNLFLKEFRKYQGKTRIIRLFEYEQ
jgi:predicted nucleotidyltransferase